MANVRDSDTSLWLHNKLGTSNDLWSDTFSIISQLNTDVLRNIRDCFSELQSTVKLKLLLSLLHINRRNVEEWKSELDEIIEVAMIDNDHWVSMMAELLRSYPSNGIINFNVDSNSDKFTDLIGEIKKLVKKHQDKGILPMECLYLNQKALNAQLGSLSSSNRHFTLKQKPKSATIRAELLQKASDAASGRGKSVNERSVAIRCRGVSQNDASKSGSSKNIFGSQTFKTPLNPNPPNKFPPNRTGSRTSVGGMKRDGGIKLIEIGEQPIGRDAKRRKKTPNEEQNEAKQKENEKAEQEISTPDYAAGLTSMIPPSPAPISYAPPPTPAAQPVVVNEPLQTPVVTPVVTQQPQQRIVVNVDNTKVMNIVSQNNMQQPIQQVQQNQRQVAAQQKQQPQINVISNQTIQQQVQTVKTSLVPKQIIVQPQMMQQQIHALQQQQIQQQIPQQQQQQQVQPTPPQQQPQTQQPMIKRQLQLSKEQMLEAQEMFKNSNKVTRPEKALILGFMAGSRENPCPQLGNVVTIKLSENEMTVEQDGNIQNLVVETHFQMNYNTGEWKRVQKYRKADQVPQQQTQSVIIQG